MLSSRVLLSSIIIIFIAYKAYNHNRGRGNADITESHEYIILDKFISSQQEHVLRSHFEKLGAFPNARADFSSNLYLDIGEGYDPDENDTMSNHYLTGGYEGFKEPSEKITSRLQLFIKHEFNAYNKSIYKSLFESNEFINSVNKICPSDYKHIKPIELNLALQLPGQGILSHRDAVYFEDATRQTHPLWLLEIMKVSHLFDDKLIPQIQGVLYIGENNKNGGELYIYPNGPRNNVFLIPPKSKSVVIMDGTEIIHGTTAYNPSIEPLIFSDVKEKILFLEFDEDVKKWRLWLDGNPTENIYEWSDIRASIAYRALCFKDEEMMNSWSEHASKSDLTIEDILSRFKHDLISRNKLSENKWNSMQPYELGKYLVSEYMELPSSELAWIPFNYYMFLEYYCDHPELYDSWYHKIIQKKLC